MKIKTKVADQEGLDRILTRITHEILEKNKGSKNLVLMGMRTRGEFLARRIHNKLRTIDGADLPIGVLDVTLYRDDFRTRITRLGRFYWFGFHFSLGFFRFRLKDKQGLPGLFLLGRGNRLPRILLMRSGRPARQTR